MHPCDFFRGSFCNDGTATAAPFRTHVNHPVGTLDDVKIVLDNDHRIALINQALQDKQKLSNIFGVQTRSWFV